MEIKANGIMYKIPEGFKRIDSRYELRFVSPNGDRFKYAKEGWDVPFLKEITHMPNGKHIPLEPVDPTQVPDKKSGAKWQLSMKLLNLLIANGRSENDYEEKLKVIESELSTLEDEATKEDIMDRLKKAVKHYRKSGTWDYSLLSKV